MAKTKRLKTVRAGRLVYTVCYTQSMLSDTKRQRQAKTQYSSEARKLLNFRTAWQKLRLLLCANFSKGDLYITLSYDDAHLPHDRKTAKKVMQLYIDRLRAARKSQGGILKYVYVTEELVNDGRDHRLHHHLIINSFSQAKDEEMVRSLWYGGQNMDVSTLGEDARYSDDFIEIAQYFCKEKNPEAKLFYTGDRSWVGSRNLERPVETSALVDEAVTVSAPPGCKIVDRESKSNEWGNFDYLYYWLPEET